MPAAEESRVIEKLGVIAGGGSIPARLLEACDRAGIETFVVGFEGQTDPEVFTGRSHMVTRIGAAGRIIDTLKSHDIADLVLIGSVRRPTLAELRPDVRTAAFFARIGLRALGDDGLLKAMRQELEGEGFHLHGVHRFARELLAAEGPMGRARPSAAHLADIRRGVEILEGMGRLDIGQGVIVQQGVVLGVEAAEGTDELIRRCAAYKRKGQGAVLVKLCKPGQETDLDLPAIGPRTVELCAQAGMAGIAVHAGRSLILDAKAVREIANGEGLFVVGIQ